jgi:hypothetical protein
MDLRIRYMPGCESPTPQASLTRDIIEDGLGIDISRVEILSLLEIFSWLHFSVTLLMIYKGTDLTIQVIGPFNSSGFLRQPKPVCKDGLLLGLVCQILYQQVIYFVLCGP